MCFETLDDLLHERNGILRTSDALARGITKSQFYEYVNSAKLEKAAHGIYVSADMLTDELYLLQAQFPRAIFSHEAALYLHDLSEYEPIPLTVTVPELQQHRTDSERRESLLRETGVVHTWFN